MRIYLGTLNHILKAKLWIEKANAIDPELVGVQIIFEEHSGVEGDSVTFRCPRESIFQLRVALENIEGE